MHSVKILLLACIIAVSSVLPIKADTLSDAIKEFNMHFYPEIFPVPPAAWYNEKGQPITMEKFRGKVVLLNVWATWCSSCVYEMPSLDKLQRRYKKAGLEVVAVATEQTVSEVTGFFLQKRLRNLAVYVDPSQSVARAYRVRSLPETFLISREGAVVAKMGGAEDWFSPAARYIIENELRQGMPEVEAPEQEEGNT